MARPKKSAPGVMVGSQSLDELTKLLTGNNAEVRMRLTLTYYSPDKRRYLCVRGQSGSCRILAHEMSFVTSLIPTIIGLIEQGARK